MPRKPRVPQQGSSTEGETGPKIRPKGNNDVENKTGLLYNDTVQ